MALNKVAASSVRLMEAPDWQIEDILPENALAMIFGPEGSHKTFFAMDMACCIATGKPFHGRKVKQCRVLYVAAEGGTPIGKRLRSWESENTTFVPDDMLTFVMEPVLLDNDEEVEEMLANLRQEEPYGLIVFDTLNMCMMGNESQPHEIVKVVRAAKRFCAAFNATVLIIHHPPKDNPNTHRGSGALSAALTTNLKVFFDGGKNTTVSCVKQKDHEPFETMVFEHHVVGESLVLREVDDEAERGLAHIKASNKSSTAGHESTILRIVMAHPDGIERAKVAKAAIEHGVPRSSAYRIIDRMERGKSISSDEDGRLFAVSR